MTIAGIAAATSLPDRFVRAIDEGRFEDLPPGIYARSYVRTFATAVGVPPDEALGAVACWLPAAPDPLPALRETAPPSAWEGWRLFLASQVRWVPCAATVRRAAGPLVDAGILLAIGCAEVAAAAWACRTTVDGLLRAAGLELALMFAITVALYGLLFEGLHEQTPGAAACGASAPGAVVVRVKSGWLRRRRAAPAGTAPAAPSAPA